MKLRVVDEDGEVLAEIEGIEEFLEQDGRITAAARVLFMHQVMRALYRAYATAG
jgi:hypothetical protein